MRTFDLIIWLKWALSGLHISTTSIIAIGYQLLIEVVIPLIHFSVADFIPYCAVFFGGIIDGAGIDATY